MIVIMLKFHKKVNKKSVILIIILKNIVAIVIKTVAEVVYLNVVVQTNAEDPRGLRICRGWYAENPISVYRRRGDLHHVREIFLQILPELVIVGKPLQRPPLQHDLAVKPAVTHIHYCNRGVG